MKQFYTLLILIFCLQLGFGQVGFVDRIITNETSDSDGPTSVYSVDINNDGKLDILSSISNEGIVWYEGLDGDGVFSNQKEIISSGNGYRFVIPADIDQDGDIDIVYARDSNDTDVIAWAENLDGLGFFSDSIIIIDNLSSPREVRAGDIDGDGDLDIISSFWNSGVVTVSENLDGLGAFGAYQILANIGYAKSIFMADMDGDNDLDILYTRDFNFGKVYWIENTDGFGTFDNQYTIASYNNDGFTSVFAADIDGDNDNDVVYSYSSRVAWKENIDGLGNFANAVIITDDQNQASYVSVADYDNDGDLDIASSSESRDRISWHKNLDGQGNFDVQQNIALNAFDALYVSSGDIDNDGFTDIMSVSFGADQIDWHKNLGNGMFSPPIAITKSTRNASFVQVGDINGDGHKDVLTASFFDNEIAWYPNNNGDTNFNIQHRIGNAGDMVFAVDIDADGDNDILSLVSSGNQKVVWYENLDGLGNFSVQLTIEEYVTYLREIYPVDIENDGDMDILALTSNDGYNFEVLLFENTDGLGNFGTEVTVFDTTLDEGSNLIVDDVDGDGDSDIILSYYNNSSSGESSGIILVKNNNGSFESEFVTGGTNSGLDEITSIYSEDIDNDNDVDIVVVTEGNDRVAWYENLDGLGDFGTQNIVSDELTNPQAVYVEDVDNDGDNDIIVGGGGFVWFDNLDGLGLSFAEPQAISFEAGAVVSIISEDLDLDGDKDFLTAGSWSRKSTCHENYLFQLNNNISGNIILDQDLNGCNSQDILVPNLIINSQSETDVFSTFSGIDGNYEIMTNEGSFITSIVSQVPSYYQYSPLFYENVFSGLGSDVLADFCIEPTGVFNDLNVTIYPSLNNPRPGFDTSYQLVFSNTGTTQLSGSVSFQFDNSKIQFLSANESIASQTSNTITFDYINLNPFETRTIDMEFNVFAPPTTNIDDVLLATATINPVSGDETDGDNIFDLQQTVIGAYDPNDITCLEGEQILLEDTDKYLHYLIRFQNTGTASAINVKVENVLDDKLDWTTMQLQSLSHNGRVEIVNENEVSFIFDNINLPDSTNDEPNSHGYIAYKIKPKLDVVLGDIFYNTAAIYFDFNPAIITNTYATEIVEEELSISEYGRDNFSVFPNPTGANLTIQSQVDITQIDIYDINGRLLKTFDDFDSRREIKVNVQDLTNGIYLLNIKSIDTEEVMRFIKN